MIVDAIMIKSNLKRNKIEDLKKEIIDEELVIDEVSEIIEDEEDGEEIAWELIWTTEYMIEKRLLDYFEYENVEGDE